MADPGAAAGRVRRIALAARGRVEVSAEFFDPLAFSVALTAGATVFAAYVVDSGRAELVALLATVTGVVNLVSRWALLPALRRWTTQAVMNGSAAMQLVGFALPAASTQTVMLVVASVLQGWARAWYWTASNAHAANMADARTKIGSISLMSSAGAVVAPLLVVAATNFRTALLLSALCNLLAMRWRLPPMRREAVSAGVAMAAKGRATTDRPSRRPLPGAGFSMLGGTLQVVAISFVPALAALLGVGAGGLGSLLFVASLAGVLGVILVRNGILTSSATSYIGIASAAPVAVAIYAGASSLAVLVAVALVAALARGVFTTLGPAAVASLPPELRTHGLVVNGTTRSVSMFAFPGAVGVFESFTSLPVALLGGTALVTAASVALEQWARHERDRSIGTRAAGAAGGHGGSAPLRVSAAGPEPPVGTDPT